MINMRIKHQKSRDTHDEKARWQRKQESAAPSRFYGDGGTIHHNTDLDVETYGGKVVAVWFRCQPLGFKVTEVDMRRAGEMGSMYRAGPTVGLTGVEVLDVVEEI